MTDSTLPDDPFALAPAVGWTPRARRQLELDGLPVELCWLPERRDRRGAPTADRPPFVADPAPRILAGESCWSDGPHAVTPNRHPFDDRHLLLWTTTARREPDAAMLALAFTLAERSGGAVLGNSIGAAASIARAHLHLLGSRQPFLDHLPREEWPDAPAALAPPDAEVGRAAAPFPALLVAIRGPVAARAAAAARLLVARTAPAYNLVDQAGTTWIYPRSAHETPAPHFPQALGSAELWGRWCHQDEAAFRAATADDLRAALGAAGHPRR